MTFSEGPSREIRLPLWFAVGARKLYPVIAIWTLFSFLSGAAGQNGTAQAPAASPWISQKSGTPASLRGLCVVDKRIVWTSGTEGTVLRTIDAGRSWSVFQVDGAETLDFRDIHAFGVNTAVILSAGTPAVVYRTADGGQSWSKRYEHPHPDAFFDAMDFWDPLHGIAMSDPVEGQVLIITTEDGGQTWTELERGKQPEAILGEGGFAASGTCLRCLSDSKVVIGLGGGLEGQVEPGCRHQKAFHALAFTSDGSTGWAVGSDGRVAKWGRGMEQSEK